MFTRLWRYLVLAAGAVVVLGPIGWIHKHAGDIGTVTKSAMFAAFAVWFLGSISRSLFVPRS
jgi:hypothetical protein